MQQIRVIIIDSNKDDILLLSDLLQRHFPQIKNAATFCEEKEVKKFLDQHEVDLVFMETTSMSFSGMELATSLALLKIPIIFITATPDNACQAFELGAIDYLLKPVTQSRLTFAIERLLQRSRIPSNSEQTLININSPFTSKIIVNNLQTIEVIDISQTIRCEAKGPYTVFHLKNNKQIIATKPLKHYEKLLEHNGFFRIHRSHMIALNEILTIDKSNMTVRINQGESLPVSADRISKFVDEFKQIIRIFNQDSL